MTGSTLGVYQGLRLAATRILRIAPLIVMRRRLEASRIACAWARAVKAPSSPPRQEIAASLDAVASVQPSEGNVAVISPERKNFEEIERLERLLQDLRANPSTARETEAIREIGLEIAIALREIGAMLINVGWEQSYAGQKPPEDS